MQGTHTVIGANGGIGQALVRELDASKFQQASVF
jgi:uncharacterized protein YbjT (DUF2867 family)